MERTKEKLLEETYRLFMEAGLSKISPDILDDISDDQIMGFGTTLDEKIFKVSGLKELLDRQKKQSAGISMHWDIKPLHRHISADENSAIFADDLFLHVTAGSDKLEMYLRFSIVLEYKNGKWVVVHWHGSKPENVESEQDTWGIESWKQKAEALEKLVEERTADLVIKNRELEMEAALERVRSRSMAMHDSSDLSAVVFAMFTELVQLDAQLDRCLLLIVNPDTLAITWYLTGKEGLLSNNGFLVPNNDYPSHQAYLDGWRNRRKKWQYHLAGQEKKDWDAFGFADTGLAQLPDFIKADMAAVESIHLTISSDDFGCLIASSLSPLSDAHAGIVERFTIVFNQTYTRFLDLQKAEAQAREAQIEAALERVRSGAMAMHNSNELAEVARVMFNQIRMLGGDLFAFGIVLCSREESTVEQWHGLGEGEMMTPFRVPVDLDYIHRYRYDQWKAGVELFSIEIPSDYIAQHFQLMFELPSVKAVMDDLADKGITVVPPSWEIDYGASFRHGYLLVSSYKPFLEDKIFPRFAKAFEQAYTRFLDLQTAEANAREARIEGALERVRSRTMAMQKSEDMNQTASEMFKQIQALGMKPWGCGFNIFDKDEKAVTQYMSLADGGISPPFRTPLTEDPFFLNIYNARQRKDELLVMESEGESLAETYRYMFELPGSGEIFGDLEKSGFEMPKFQITHCAYFSQGYLVFITYEHVPESHDIFKRFAKIFEQTYTRFLDLKKAEEQAREAQIEAALERIRSRTMAMHSSQEVGITVAAMFNELVQLGIDKATRCGIAIFKSQEIIEIWTAFKGKDDSVLLDIGRISIGLHPLLEGALHAWMNNQPEFVYQLAGEDLVDYYEKMRKAPEYSFQIDMKALPPALTHYEYFFSEGSLFAFSRWPLTSEQSQILMRFANVFGQTYRRFLDLKKAEAQAREAQIEASLERVRSRSLAMHKSEELADLSLELVKQVQALGVKTWFCAFNIYDDDLHGSLEWGSNGEGTFPEYRTPREGVFLRYYEAGQGGETLLINEIGEDECPAHYEYLCSLPGVGDQLLKMKAAGIPFPAAQIDHVAFFKYGYLLFISYNPVPESHDIFKRFARVFEQSYTRFLDLKNAEAQAREAQIEAALERVRSRTMGMQKSTELNEVAFVLFEQIRLLGGRLWGTGFALCDVPEGYDEFWFANEMGVMPPVSIPNNEDEVHQAMLQGWKQNREYLLKEKGGEALAEHYEYLCSLPQAKAFFDPMLAAGFTFPTWQQWHAAYFSKGYLLIITTDPYAENDIFKRFAKVFDQTYTRFLDLQRAEEQAREAQIEASLERVRSKTMAMHNSEDVGETVATLFDEFEKLGVHTNRCGILINSREQMQAEVWTAKSNPSGKANLIIGQLDLTMHPLLEGIYHAWKNKEPVFYYTMAGVDLRSYYQAINNTKYYPTQFDLDALPSKEFHADFYFAEGSIFAFTSEAIKEEAASIFKRFAKVFGQTYRRYLDLQKAELQTRQAKIETALEKVRARALAMQVPEELTEVAQVMRYEMGLLGVEELETSSIYIHDDTSANAACWYAIKDSKVPEKNLVADHFILNLKDTWVGRQMFEFYHSGKKQVSIPMQGVNRKEWINYCSKQSKLLDGFYGEVIPDRTYHLYKFSNGTIGAATPGDISAESWELLSRAASAFSLAYSRFKDLTQSRNDLIKLKEEKNRAEEALTELQITQKQLIHAEKMASLGELTAGIAHEIQNPLNFVNNFSEVSKELLSELSEEVEKGNYDEVNAIVADVQQNLEKIHHHGERAASIVKGMLQHSRSSTGAKEPTDINALIDEYVRLAYHGLKAKDKSFNATYITNFDPDIPPVQIIPQDMGRVLLNLINNAFYAVHEKKKTAKEDYKPEVIASSEVKGDSIVLFVSDNGNGIPEGIRGKIFQPFFTTKPTGEGTGLGLSLSYDIVKSHGGEIKVETKEGEGTTFMINLPITYV